jgi:hypothetical protein
MTYPQDPDVETPLEDAAEQATSAVPERLEDGPAEEVETGDDARVVELDDEYR